MRRIHLRVDITTDDPPSAFALLADFTRFPDLAEDVHAVQTRPYQPVRYSDWEVNFRRGIMRWTEEEAVDHERLRIDFDQTDGDFEEFRGSWQLIPNAAGAEVYFEVTYDFGIESLVGIMDPIAERVIKRAICSVLTGLFTRISVREGGEALRDLADPPPRPASQLSGAN
ncbi:type II toxin-antitoxin system RatA family toxin [Streptomyces sp. NPDC004296]|uniref:type II toxin-antitoxin system RatA family toxin n=1 Tax=Streptomyces sp. NPDC004296 TaxID=3364697 RepID=UPI0036CCBCE6